MFKTFYLNEDYKFDFYGNYTYKGKEIKSNSEDVEIDVYGNKTVFNRKHIGLYTHFRMNPFIIPIDNVEFIRVDSKVHKFVCGHLPVFKEPIEIGYGFRIIPGFSHFAINEKSDILSYKTGNILTQSFNPYGYRSVSIYDPEKDTWRSVVVHMLLARAFIKNTDPSNKFYVNHKNGIKTDLSLNNLEWCTPKENNIHAVQTGLVKKATGCTVHDLITGESSDYPSVRTALKAKKITNNWVGKTRLVCGVSYPRVYSKRYVITDIGETLVNYETLYNGLPNSRSSNIGPYQALEIDTGIIIECNSFKELTMATEVPYDHVRAIMESVVPKKSNGYYFRVKSDKSFPTEFVNLVTYSRRSFKVINKETQKETYFTSLSKLADFLKIAKKTLYQILKNEKKHPVYEIQEMI